MFGRVVEHMAALAQGREVCRHVVPRIVIEMCAGEDDIGGADANQLEAIADRDPSTSLGTPAARFGVPPAAIAEMCNETPMRPRAMFAARPGPTKADRVRQLRPVDRIEPAVFGADRHRDSMSHRRFEGKRNLSPFVAVLFRTCSRSGSACGNSTTA